MSNVMSAKDHQKMAKWIPLIQKYSTSKNIPYDMLYRQVWQESQGNEKAVGDSGRSRGLMQIHENAAKDMKITDFNKLFDPEFNIQSGTNFIMRLRSQLQHLLPQDQKQAWAMIFMSYNSGVGYMIKALKKIRAAGNNNPTLAQVVAEMQKADFGKKPMLNLTVPYAMFTAMGLKDGITQVAKSLAQPKVNIPLLAAVGFGAYLLFSRKRVIA